MRGKKDERKMSVSNAEKIDKLVKILFSYEHEQLGTSGTQHTLLKYFQPH